MASEKVRRGCCSCGISNRSKCKYIGFMNLIAGIVNISLHLFILGMISNGFQCDVDNNLVKQGWWTAGWFRFLYMFINFGTHGFYPYPGAAHGHFILTGSAHGPLDYTPRHIQCYPGMLHIYLIDVLNVLINVIWLKFVIEYVKALYRKDPKPMNMFFNIYLLKWIIQVINVLFTPDIDCDNMPSTWPLKYSDLCFTLILLYYIRAYAKELKAAQNEEVSCGNDLPPSYFESIMATLAPKQEPKKEKETEATEKKGTDIVVPVEGNPVTEIPKNQV